MIADMSLVMSACLLYPISRFIVYTTLLYNPYPKKVSHLVIQHSYIDIIQPYDSSYDSASSYCCAKPYQNHHGDVISRKGDPAFPERNQRIRRRCRYLGLGWGVGNRVVCLRRGCWDAEVDADVGAWGECRTSQSRYRYPSSPQNPPKRDYPYCNRTVPTSSPSRSSSAEHLPGPRYPP